MGYSDKQSSKPTAADGKKPYDPTKIGSLPPDGQYTREQLNARLQNHADQHENAIHAAYTAQTTQPVKDEFKGLQKPIYDKGQPLVVGAGKSVSKPMVKDASPIASRGK